MEFIKDPEPISEEWNIHQVFEDSWHNQWVIYTNAKMQSRVFFRRAKGTGLNYDKWHEIDITSDINEDLKATEEYIS